MSDPKTKSARSRADDGSATLDEGWPPGAIPTFAEALPGALIDAARISVGAAMHLLGPPVELLIATAEELEAQDPTIHDCLTQAAQWLDAARQLSVEQASTPPTSIHVVSEMPRGGR